MCLRTYESKPTVLDKEQMVFKVIRRTNDSMYQRMPYSPHTLYYLGKPLELLGSNKEKFYVNEGFHAYVDKPHAIQEVANAVTEREDLKIVICFFPKGSNVYHGIRGDIVSDTMMTGNLDAE